jgi:malate synthase
MAAFIPIRTDAEANAAALAGVRDDKLREVQAGHDGTWVAHPALVPLAREVFDQFMPQPNQVGRLTTSTATAADLLTPPTGPITAAGLDRNLDVGLQYLAAWLGGNGCVPIYNLMEDAATAEISRSQIWQWIRHRATLDDGRTVTRELVREILDEEMERIHAEVGDEVWEKGRPKQTRQVFELVALSEEFPEFLTIPAYKLLD